MLRVPRVEHLDYLRCERLRTMSKDEMISAFCERPSDWGDRQFTPCKVFTKGPRLINMVMTFVLHQHIKKISTMYVNNGHKTHAQE